MTSLSELCWLFVDGEETAGAYVYALFPSGRTVPETLTVGNIDYEFQTVALPDWTVLYSEVRFDDDASNGSILGLFDSVANEVQAAGALAVWFGGETSTWNPSVLDPEASAGNVVAAKVGGSWLVTNSHAGSFDYLDDDALRMIWSQLLAAGVSRDVGRD